MAVLSDAALTDAIRDGSLVVKPLGERATQPNSIDVRLGAELLVATPDGFRPHHLIDQGPLRLGLHTFVLGSTLEWVEIGNGLTAHVWGKSSRAREGIQVHAAGLVDTGWRGRLTLEIVMLAPLPNVFLMHGMGIAQLQVHEATWCRKPYGSEGVGRYQDSHGPIESRGVVGRPS